ncbi:MAG: Tim44/TimA family putative adaptor protein, partial [Alphaproteobacteria bacterium]|nr:Tim44/TimA family putative adaptor protein [Alphaproteobacteria bacterium]
MAYADIVILALIAGFVLLRLRSVLGQKTGFEGSPYAERKREPEKPVVRVVEAAARLKQVVEDRDAGLVAAVQNPQAREALAAIKAADADFTVEHFLQGARHAFEMTFDAFVKGDRETLSM